MPFVSEIIGKPVNDIDGVNIGTVKDIIATTEKIQVPKIVALKVKTAKDIIDIRIADVAALIAKSIPLNIKIDEILAYEPTEHDLLLNLNVLDKQIIDTNGVRVVRVNDLELTRLKGDYYVSNVDVGGAGMLRRLGLGALARKTVRPQAQTKPGGFISWEDVELLSSEEPLRLKVPNEKLAEMHPADLAEILSDLNRNEGSKLLESLDDETMADALEEVEPDFQASLVEQMDNERVADVLEEMSPDEAADLLAELSEERKSALLNLMEKDEADDVRRLLAYPDDSAGGIMTTEFIAVPKAHSAGKVINLLREMPEDETETMFDIYVVDDNNHLCGVFSLRQLVLAKPATPVTDFMEDRVVVLDPLDDQDRAAQLISKYNLHAIPVVDRDNVILGIVTADDALDKIIPTAWKKRLPRLYH
ncbi:MAG: magnesium transporter [Anaerolineaceae bacterium]